MKSKCAKRGGIGTGGPRELKVRDEVPVGAQEPGGLPKPQLASFSRASGEEKGCLNRKFTTQGLMCL